MIEADIILAAAFHHILIPVILGLAAALAVIWIVRRRKSK
jgi:LPXTG-motif cell wall-anchored protein